MNRSIGKILFLCAGLEPGQDAVGDYTHCLAKACLLYGVKGHILALNDHHCREPLEKVLGYIPAMRLPQRLGNRGRRRLLSRALAEWKPDVVSLQFVAYGFQPKGLPWKLGTELRNCLGDLPVHIMFHEIWIGADRRTSLKHRVVGCMQKLVHLRLLRQLQPCCVHTHAEPYRRALLEAGIEVRSLPLPSNLPVAVKPDNGFVWEQFSAAGMAVNEADRESLAVFLVFGHVPPEWDPDRLLPELEAYRRRSGRKPVLFFSGRGGLDDKRREQIWAVAGAYGVTCVSAGFLPAEQVSALMQFADFGVATVPFALWQKSGVVAAMRAHGLPVIFTRFDGDWPTDWLTSWEEDFLRCDEDLAERLDACPRPKPHDRWPEVMDTFLSDIDVFFEQ